MLSLNMCDKYVEDKIKNEKMRQNVNTFGYQCNNVF